MMQAKLSDSKIRLLEEVLKKHQAGLLSLIREDTISPEKIEELCDIIMDEFCENGLKPNDEPNQRGLELENLVDALRELASPK